MMMMMMYHDHFPFRRIERMGEPGPKRKSKDGREIPIRNG